MSNLAAYLEESAERFPDRLAVVDPDGSQLTYAELDDRANRVARFLATHGVAPGDRVGLALPKSAAAVTAIFGILKARAAYVPVDYSAPAARNRSILTDAGVRVAFVGRTLANLLDDLDPAARPNAIVVIGSGEAPPTSSVITEWSDVLRFEAQRPPASDRSQDDLAYILYTSGSTGVPKGVMLTHQNAMSFVDWCSSVFKPIEHDRFSSHAPFHFDLSVLDIYLSLKHGAALFLISEELGKDARKLASFIAENRLTVWYSTPSILSLLAQYGGIGQAAPGVYNSLRVVLFAGEVFPVKHLRDVTRCWPHAEYYNLYGPTETNVCTFARIPLPVPEDRAEPYPIGHACSHCTPLVLDDGVSVAPGGEGLLYISGPSVFHGYWNRPKENAEAFIERDGARWYNTGDVVREDPNNGFIYVGRRDRMVKRRGYRIELGEIERGLYQHPQLREAAVVAIPDAVTGVKILAFIARNAEPRPSIVDLKQFCAKNLPGYMSPDVFVPLDALPRTSTDKVDYQRLAQRARQPLNQP
jgi:amino acid adenylation domain-containing protein